MSNQFFTIGNGKQVKLGRVRVLRAFNAGRFRVTRYTNGKVSVNARFDANYDSNKDIAPPPVTTSWLSKCLAAIAMTYGNTKEGDCVIASILHIFGGWTGNEIGIPALSNESESLQTYATICGPGDNGCVITDVLDYAKANGIPMTGVAHKIDNYVAIDWTNQNLVQVAVQLFGPAIKLGLNLPGDWMNAASGNGFVWDVTNSSSIGGHDVPIIDVTPEGVVISTWGMWGTITWAALASTVIFEESWLSLAPDWYSSNDLAPNGVNVATLQADLALVGQGTAPPIPGPIPPTPPTPPTPPNPPIPPVPPVPAGSTIVLTLPDSSTFTIAGTYAPILGPKAPLGSVNFIQILSDVLAIYAAVESKNVTAEIAAVTQLLTDLGINVASLTPKK